jgi:hypothetical protein
MPQPPPQVAQVIGDHAELQAHFVASRQAALLIFSPGRVFDTGSRQSPQKVTSQSGSAAFCATLTRPRA